MKYIVVGAGFSGSVIAQRISEVFKENVLLIDKRTHVAGTSYSHRDGETGIDIHDFGSHIFHTNNQLVWEYINRFGTFSQYQHHVILQTHGITTQMPINLRTISDIYNRNFNPSEANEFLNKEISKSHIDNPKNLEEKAVSLIGEKIYDYCIKGYTSKQWNKLPTALPESIIKRLPIRYNYNPNYFNDRYQGIPENGYNNLVSNIIDNNNIELKLKTSFDEVKNNIASDTKVFYSGMIDEFFDYKFGKLEWRSLRFELETVDVEDYQGNSIVNYGDIETPYTRIHEFKHYQPERNELFNIGKTIICREYPQDWTQGKEAYYPIESERNIELLKKYQCYAKENCPNVTFIGRLGKYKYFDMDKAILDSLNTFKEIFNV